jgi:hypothetical protein
MDYWVFMRKRCDEDSTEDSLVKYAKQYAAHGLPAYMLKRPAAAVAGEGQPQEKEPEKADMCSSVLEKEEDGEAKGEASEVEKKSNCEAKGEVEEKESDCKAKGEAEEEEKESIRATCLPAFWRTTATCVPAFWRTRAASSRSEARCHH